MYNECVNTYQASSGGASPYFLGTSAGKFGYLYSSLSLTSSKIFSGSRGKYHPSVDLNPFPM